MGAGSVSSCQCEDYDAYQDNSAYFILQKFIKEKVDKYLDITQSFSKQDKAKVKAICNLVSQNN